MPEIMQRMLDNVQLRLQSKERDLCAALNATAERLLLTSAPEDDDADDGDHQQRSSTTTPSKKGKKLHQPQGSTEAERLQRARTLLEQSWRVGEKGIDAMDVEDISFLPDIPGGDASIRAWRLIQVNTCNRLLDVCNRLEDTAAATRYAAEADAKSGELRDAVDVAAAAATSKLDALVREKASLEQRIRHAAAACAAKQLPILLYGDVDAWLTAVGEEYAKAARREERARSVRQRADGQAVQVLLGKEVTKHLALIEKPLVEMRTGLENALLARGLWSGLRRVRVLGGVMMWTRDDDGFMCKYIML